MTPSVLVTRRLPASVLAKLELGCDVDLHPGPNGLSPHALQDRVKGKAGLVCLVTDRIDRAVIDAGTDLRVITNVAVGYDNVDARYARTRDVIVTNTPDVLTEATAEFTWGLILSITRRITEGDRLIRAGRWKGWALDFMLGTELQGKRLGVVGPGRIGRAVAARAEAFGMDVVLAGTGTTSSSGQSVSLDELLATSDVVSLHVPMTEQTRHLIDRRALTRMKRTGYLVNASRGTVVDEAALVWALGQHLIAGAALDVYEREPVVHQGLLSFENVVLTPHLGSGTREARTAMAELAVANVVAVLGGKPPLTLVTP